MQEKLKNIENFVTELSEHIKNALTELRGLYNSQCCVKLLAIKLIPLLNDILQGSGHGREFMMHFPN
jgi:hypothetical protein